MNMTNCGDPMKFICYQLDPDKGIYHADHCYSESKVHQAFGFLDHEYLVFQMQPVRELSFVRPSYPVGTPSASTKTNTASADSTKSLR